MTTKKYQIIYADPPWRYNDPKGNNPAMGGITYPTMADTEIQSLPVSNLAGKNCVLFLWATMPKLPEAIEVLRAWGFKYVTCAFTWVKLNPSSKGYYSGLGHWCNGNAELVLLGKIGHPKRVCKCVKQLQVWPRSHHSAKPPQIRNEIIRLLGDLPRIELFARQKTGGWDAWGNEVESDIELINKVARRSQ
jgi:site-specific DNA-methyltransferase (adenine-specific)